MNTARCEDSRGIPSRAEKAALLIDNSAYFSAAAQAIRRARHSIWLIGWEFDPRTVLEPDRSDQTIGSLLNEVGRSRPGLQIKVLIWRAALPVALSKGLMPHRAWLWFRNSSVDFRLDDSAPAGACLHQKLLVVDEHVAFCSGADFARNRWDDMQHAGRSELRARACGRQVPPRHSSTMLVEGRAAQALAAEAQARWQAATGERIPNAAPAVPGDSCWPAELKPDFRDVPLCISRTLPLSGRMPAVRENASSYLAAIAGAQDSIYIETQYFTSSTIADELIEKLQDPDGPEILLVTGQHSPSFFDRAVMDPARDVLLEKVHKADRFGRFAALAPRARNGEPILVHSKLMIVDDRLLHLGSSNLSNRSLGYDRECDLTVSLGRNDPGAAQMLRLRCELIGHFLDGDECLGRSDQSSASAWPLPKEGAGERLRPIGRRAKGITSRLIARHRIGDPESVAQAWRPWRRS